MIYLFSFFIFIHAVVLINLFRVVSSLGFKIFMGFTLFSASISFVLFFTNGIDLITTIFNYFDIPLLEKTFISLFLFINIFVTGIISFFSLIFGPGRLRNNSNKTPKS
jgi:hypothetical protein